MSKERKNTVRDMNQNKLREKTVAAKTVFLRGIRGFVIILLAGFLVLTGLTFSDYRKESLTEASLSGIRELVMIDNEVEAVQGFRAKFTNLDTVYVYFANEQEGKNQGTILFKLLDQAGREVAANQIEASKIVNKDFTAVKLNASLTPGKTYRFVISGEGLTAGKSPILYRQKQSFGSNHVVLSGVTGSAKMEISYYYPAETWVQMALIMGAILALMMLVLVKRERIFVGPKTEFIGKYAEKLIFFLVPFLSFFMVEHFTYNSIGDIYFAGTVMNLVIYYCLYFLGYMITNSRRATVIGCLLISYILGAANYFVLSFRGTPILPTDIASFTTAMNVAENYTYSLNSAFFTNALLAFFVAIFYCKLRPGRTMTIKRRAALFGTVMAACVCVGAFIGQEKILEEYHVKADIWNQKRGYSRDGALASFFLNAKYLYAEKPDGYSVDKVKEIAETYIWNEGESASLNGISSSTKKKTSEKKETEKSSKKKTQHHNDYE
ncbi:MAG: hypothetical protein Q4B70_07195 [Lachnospiraceae bacterium]|nr:hypothetical protein [Lachnospiraceae bacterium]